MGKKYTTDIISVGDHNLDSSMMASLNTVVSNHSNYATTSQLFSGNYNDLTNKPTIPSLSGYATQSYVTTQINNLVDSAPGTLNTLNELAAALGDDANFSTTVTNSIATKLPLSGGTITGGLTIAGNLARGTYVSASNYHTNADNLVLKGNSSGISGIFFESEKDGTNINHPSDFGFIQYHPYGTGTSGENAELIIGVSNDASDHIILNAPAATGVRVRIGNSETDYALYHEGHKPTASEIGASEILTAIKTVDGSGSGLDADTVDGFERKHFTHAEDAKVWTGINASDTQAKRYHIARLYGCPAHWDSNWQNIEFIVTAESYESAFLKFRLMGDYGGAGSQANMIKLYLQDAQGPLVNSFRFVLGSPVDAGWDHSGQDTFYVDLYAEARHYGQYEIHAKTYGHVTQSSNPTSGGATTVFYGSPTTTNISDFSVNHIDPTFRGYKIWHAGNDSANSGLDADLLDGQHASAFQPAGTYNTVIGTDSDINTSGSTIIDNIYVTDGVITSMGTRTLTAGDIGAATASHTHTWANISGETANSVNSWGGLRHQTNDGYIDFGPANSGHAHIYTDRPNFYFNKELLVNNSRVFHQGYHPNADTLTTARTIAGTSFNGSANIDISYNNLTNKPTIPSGSSLVRVYENQDYVASGSSTSNRGNFGAGLTVYEGYNLGANRPHTFDTTLQVMSNNNQGFELSADWVSTSTTPLKIRSLRDCCQGWSPWRDVAVAEDVVNGNFLFADNVGIGTTSPPSEKLHVSGNVRVTGSFKDSSGDSGIPGQVLSSTGSGTTWINNDTGDIAGVTAGSGLTGGGTSGTVTVSHADTSSQGSVNNSGGTVIQDITLDTYGHITGLTSYNLDGRYYTETESDSRFVNVTGDAISGNLSVTGNVGIGTTDPQKPLDVNGEVLLRDHLFVGGYGENGSTNSIEIGRNRSGNGTCFFDMTTDNTTYTDYGFRLVRYSGVNANTELIHRGTGDFRIKSQESSSMRFYTGNSARMSITSGGNVGIGTTSPSAKLQVAGTVKSSGLDVDGQANSSINFLQYTRTDSTQPASMSYDGTGGFDFNLNGGTVKFSDTNGGSVGIGTTSPSEKLAVNGNIETTSPQGKIGFNVGDAYGDYPHYGLGKTTGANPVNLSGYFGLTFGTVGSEQMRITNTGNVGIGTNSPSAKLDVVGNISADNVVSIQGIDTGNPSASSEQLRLSGYGVLGNRSAMYITNGHSTGTLRFGIGGAGVGGGVKMLLNSSGNLGIGTTSPAQKLHVEGTIAANTGGFEIRTGSYGNLGLKSYYGSLYTTTNVYVGGVNGISYKSISASSFNVNSDYRLKSNLVTLEDAVSRIKKLPVHRFNWKDRENENKVDGFLAHEVSDVVPEAVTGEKDAVREDGTLEYQQVDQSKIVPLLTAALKEAIEKIEQLETRIQTLENN